MTPTAETRRHARTSHAAQALYESLGWVRDEVFYAYSRTVSP